MNIILCGMPGSGKSYYGALAAERLQRQFIDTDELVMSDYYRSTLCKATCREIARREGADFFYSMENQAIRSLRGVHHSIIAVGGGAFCREDNIELLKAMGKILYLKVDPSILLKRLKEKSPFPSYLEESDIEGSFERLLKKRLPLYEENCDATIDVASEDVLAVICSQIGI